MPGPCKLDKSSFTVTLGGNKVYAPKKSVTINCGKTMGFAEFEASGLDEGTTIEDAPTAAEIIAMGQAILNW